MKLRDAKLCKLQVNEKTLSRILRHAFCLRFHRIHHFLRIHHDYFLQRGFESVRAQFFSGNINEKQCCLRSSRREVLYKKIALRDKVFSCEFCRISKTTFSYRRLPVTASVICKLPVQLRFIQVNFLHAEYGIWRSLE